MVYAPRGFVLATVSSCGDQRVCGRGRRATASDAGRVVVPRQKHSVWHLPWALLQITDFEVCRAPCPSRRRGCPLSQLITCRGRPLASGRPTTEVRPLAGRSSKAWPLRQVRARNAQPLPARETPNSPVVHHNAEGRRTQRRVPQLDHLTGRPLACTRRSGRRASSMPAHQALRASCASDSTRPASSYHGRRSALCGAPTRA